MHYPKGTAVARIGMAVNRSENRNGRDEEEVTFVDVGTFGRQAEVIAQ
jgi:single-stranded DNA-binding protein